MRQRIIIVSSVSSRNLGAYLAQCLICETKWKLSLSQSVLVRILTHKPFIIFCLPCPAVESEGVALVGAGVLKKTNYEIREMLPALSLRCENIKLFMLI